MASVKSEHIIKAPVEMVFDRVTNVANFTTVAPHIKSVEFLSEQTSGIGTKFRETRVMKGRENSTVLEITEYDPPHRARFITDQGGTIWDSVYTTEAAEEGTKLTLVMEARPHRFAAKLITPLIMGMVSKAIEEDNLAVKAHCETTAG